MKLVLFGALAVAAGAAGGLGAGLWLAESGSQAPPISAPRAAGDDRDQSAGRVSVPRFEAGVAPSLPALPVPSAVEEQPAAEAAARLSPEDADARWQQLYQGKVAAVQAEARDPSWARATEASFQQDFRDATQKHEATLVGLDCRTTGCLARVEWGSYALAKRKFPDILHASYRVNCATTVDVGPQPEVDNRPVQATVVFECEQSRIAELAGG